jgi:excisionase family DNA binding protein
MQTQELLSKLCPFIGQTIKATIQNELESILSKIAFKFSEQDTLSAIEAADYLKIELGTLYKKVQNNEIPFRRTGKRKLLFSKKELNQHLENGKGKTQADIDEDVLKYMSRKKKR